MGYTRINGFRDRQRFKILNNLIQYNICYYLIANNFRYFYDKVVCHAFNLYCGV